MAASGLTPSIQCPAPTLAQGAQGIARVAVDDANTRLTVTFLAPITAAQQVYLSSPLSYSLTGGQRLFPRILTATIATPGSPPGADSNSVVLSLDGLGDFSIYTLTASGPDIDPFFSSARLRFRLGCDDSFDCRLPAAQPTPQAELAVAIDYLTKDYAGFRQALLDFLPTRLPGWTERSEADLGMMLLELFSATADELSYMQDRVANEAFLETATQRRSVAGHLALVGYQMDDGASASTWLQFQVNDSHLLPAGFKVSNNPATSDDPVIVFETLTDVQLESTHNRMSLYDWGNSQCCLPGTALNATLVGTFDDLKAGDYLLFDGGGRRDVVQLTAAPVVVTVGNSGAPPGAQVVTQVTWAASTPLHHDYCVQGTVVRGNVVVATHGETVEETLRSLTDQQKAEVNAEIAARPLGARAPRQRLKLSWAPLAHLDARTMTPSSSSTSGAAQTAVGDFTARPPRSVSTLQLKVDGQLWQEKTSLLEAGSDDQSYRLEIDDAGEATVVFGDGVFGLRPAETSTLTAVYRVGGGATGNVGGDTLTLARSADPTPWLSSVTNPLPATGGRDWESGDHARRFAPPSFQQTLVAVSAADYQTAAAEFVNSDGSPAIQRANASFRWTGSWLTVTLTIDPLGVEGFTSALRQQLTDYLNSRRLSGYDLELAGPIYLAVDLGIQISVAEGSQQGDVQQAVLLGLSNDAVADGSKGFFHPDNFTFGDNLYISRLYAAVMEVPGVQSVEITRLAASHSAQPDRETAANLAQGFLAVGPDQVVRLDNDRNFPQNGTLTVTVSGAQA